MKIMAIGVPSSSRGWAIGGGLLLGVILGLGEGTADPAGARSDPTSLYTQAGDLYQAGRYQQAAQLYQQIVAQGIRNGAVFYNLGNAYFQLGQLGRAIVNYHRALYYLPRDEDVATNLAYAQSLRQDEMESASPRGWGARLFGFTERLSLNECGKLVSGVYFIFLAWLGGYLFWPSEGGRRVARYGLGVSLLVGLYLGMAGGWKGIAPIRDVRVVVVSPEVEVRHGPGEHATVMFKVHDGAEMLFRERRGGWSRVALAAGQTGWVRNAEVEAVWPRKDGRRRE